MVEPGDAGANRGLRPQQVIVLAVGATGAGDGKASPAGQVAPAQTSPPPPPPPPSLPLNPLHLPTQTEGVNVVCALALTKTKQLTRTITVQY